MNGLQQTHHDFFYNKQFTEGAGLKGAIDLKTAKLIVKYFNKDIIKEIEHIKVEDNDLSINSISCNITNINFGILNYSYEKVKINFEPKNKIHISLNGIKGWGQFSLFFQLLLVNHSDTISFEINNISVYATVIIRSKNVGGKLLPDAVITTLNYNYDFDFEINSSLGYIVSLFKTPIKNLITKRLNNLIDEEINHGLQIGLSMIPNEIIVDKKKGYIIDYSLISDPFIENNFILFNSYARFINKNIKETQNKDNYFRPYSIPSYDLLGKSSQIYISDYVINTALYTFFKTRDLNILITPDMLPENLPLIKLNTSWLNMIFKDLSSVYGMDQNVYINLIVCENPQLILKDKLISFILPTNIEILVEGFEGIAVKFRTTFFVDAVFKVFENCKISGKIENLNIKNTQIIWGYTDDENFGSNIENHFNMLKGLALPFINMYVLNNMQYPLPVIRGIKFTDLTISHHENFINVNYNFQYNENEN